MSCLKNPTRIILINIEFTEAVHPMQGEGVKQERRGLKFAINQESAKRILRTGW
jgi:hypothetical protein